MCRGPLVSSTSKGPDFIAGLRLDLGTICAAVGANVGGSWGDWRADSSQRVYNFESFTANPKVDGILGGVQAGYNWRLAPQWLWGIEGDIQATSERASQTWIDPGLPNTLPLLSDDFVPRSGGPATLSHEWEFPWFGTVRLRAGYNPSTN